WVPGAEELPACRFEQFNRITIRVLQLNLFAARANFHFVAEMQAGLLERLDLFLEVRHLQHDAIPSPCPLAAPVRHRTGARCVRPAESQFQFADCYQGECRRTRLIQFEAELACIERDCARDIFDLIANSPETCSERRCFVSERLCSGLVHITS